MKKPNRISGFTLVELLVVIAIVSVLASLGFMTARKGIQASRASTTVNNLKQIGTCIHIIREDGTENGWSRPGNFPGYAGQINEPGNWREFTIHELIAEVQEACDVKNGKYVWNVLPSETILQNPLSEHRLAGAAGSPDKVTHAMLAKPWGSYCYNAQLEGWTAPHTPESKVRATRMVGRNKQGKSLEDPGLTIMMAEAGDGELGHPLYTGWSGVAAPHGNYKDGAHCVFVDGHVERIANSFLASEKGVQKHMWVDGKR